MVTTSSVFSSYQSHNRKDIVEKLVLGGEVRDTKTFSYLDARLDSWKSSDLQLRVAIESTSVPGLYIIRHALPESKLTAIRSMISKTCLFDKEGHRSPTRWSWFEYDPARFIVGVLPNASFNSTPRHVQLSQLRDFEVFHSAPPEQWLDMTLLCKSVDDDIAAGAQALSQMQTSLLNFLPPPMPISSCLFLQLQYLEAGARVMPHVDADDPPIDIIATIPITGGTDNLLRVASCEFKISPGDAYILSGKARFDVKHEVLAASEDRISVTMRFVNQQLRDMRTVR